MSRLSESQKTSLRKSWKIIYAEMGSSLSYVGSDTTGVQSSSAAGGGGSRGVAETFLR